MISDLKELIDICKWELREREYLEGYTDVLEKEWNAVLQWHLQEGLSAFSQKTGYQYCDEVFGSHIILPDMTTRIKQRLRAVRMLISYQQDGDFEFRTPRVERIFSGETGELILEFLHHERMAGRSEKTIEFREMALYNFNQYLTGQRLSFADLDVDTIEDFFKSMNYPLPSRHNCSIQLRQLFHYLYNYGHTSIDYSIYVLKDRYRSESKIPTTYEENEISKMLSAVERSSAIGKRDYLVLLLAAEYGWRSGDIVSFRFSQIDWEQNRISFDQEKTGIPVEFPLLSSVGNAIIDYLKHGRPKSDALEVIVSAKPGKKGQPLTPPTIHSIVSRYMAKAEISNWKEKKHGPHSLRHSLASNMLKRNVSMPIISTVLGHQNTETTKIYLKVDIEKLLLCPLPAPAINSLHYEEVDSK